MTSLAIEKYEDVSSYIVFLFKNWKLNNKDNTLTRLTRMIDSDFDYNCIRRVVLGELKSISFDLFDCIFRAVNPDRSEYLLSIQKWFPHMISVADRISLAGLKPDKTYFLDEPLTKEIYQYLISGLELTRTEIAGEWGRAGILSLNRILSTEHVFEDVDGKIKVNCEDGYLRFGGHIAMNLISHNVSKVTPENSGTGDNYFYHRVFYISSEKKELLRQKTRELSCWINSNFNEKKDAKSGNEVISIQTVMRTHKFGDV